MFLRKYLPLLLCALLFLCFFYYQHYYNVSLESLIKNHELLIHWKEEHYWLAVTIYVLFYSAAVSASIPGALFFSLFGGLLFGPFPGVLYVVFSATLGSTFFYLAVNLALKDQFRKRLGQRLRHFEQNFQKNAFYYLLSLRLIPVFPFFVINIVSGLLAVPLPVFITATLLGLFPSSLIYTTLGQNLGLLLTSPDQSLLELTLKPHFFLPLCALATLALLPILGQRYFKIGERA